MITKSFLPASLVFGIALPLLGGGTTDLAALSDPASLLTHPFWSSGTVVRESVLFVKQDGGATATAKLFFVPDEILAVHSATGERIFKTGVDFVWKRGSRELALTPASGIPSQTLADMSVGGMGVVWGVKRAPAVAEEKPDLVVIAFGMNDTSMPCTEWAGEIEKLVAAVRQGAPEAEFILVSPMCGNPQWEKMRDEAFLDFRSTLGALKGPGIAVADVTSVWLELAKRKPYWDYTGNGVNHPNDFGHRLYAQVILALFAKPK